MGSDGQVRFRVCSRTMARQSPVFGRLLFGGFGESVSNAKRDPGGEWEVELPDDASSSMERLLRMMHGTRYSRFPSTSEMFIVKLYDLVVTADKTAWRCSSRLLRIGSCPYRQATSTSRASCV
ncbi:uncharacterized protein B0I36DRAFT_337154 [Microdochium trichocladiopsis]|uniref:BTB domain-containing protein n=1 Tax=Microdochium trichocladiopsis TaxID=1682393 RepID=A0A9P8XT32_9PEZI|nr:uncharacterized protein B0I36DRAFT_337154 [Microdochium trichocladiopsis]KAH7016262.1 hypothetical protein B0I36DRAFT_337154 [Microdochium trichocladiopsis]